MPVIEKTHMTEGNSLSRAQQGFLEMKGDKKQTHNLAFYRFIIDSLPVAVITVNSELKITSFNPWAEEVTGYSAAEAMGHYCGEILQGGMCHINCPLRTVIGRENPVVRLETTIVNKRRETIPVRMNSAALLDHDGNLIGGLEAFQDVSHLKALEREKDNFISMIAHDMRSSLVVIGGFVLRLLNKTANKRLEKEQKYLHIIRNETDKLESLVNDFLEFSRLKTGTLKLNFGETSLDEELMTLVEAYEPKASQHGIRLRLEIAEALPIIKADAGQLHRVFANLLDNALKFSKEKGEITITTRENDQSVVIKFADQGVGIDPVDLPYLFDPFHRGRVGGKVEGFGLGLAAVKAIVDGHKGRVLVQSELGKGSIFTVVLPKTKSGVTGAENRRRGGK